MSTSSIVTDDMMLAAMPVLIPYMNGTLEEKRKRIRVAIANVLFVIAGEQSPKFPEPGRIAASEDDETSGDNYGDLMRAIKP